MKRFALVRFFLAGVLCAVHWSSLAVTPVCSVQVESYATLQEQLLLGAGVFEAPVLGALPMMMQAGAPQVAQIDRQKPVSLHVLDAGDGEPAVLLEFTPAIAPEAFLRSLAGGAELPAPADGIYHAGTFYARMRDGRMVMSREEEHIRLCGADGPLGLPVSEDSDGVLKVSIAPRALNPMIEKGRQALNSVLESAAPGGDEDPRAMVGSLFDLYQWLLGQVDFLDLALNVQAGGLSIQMGLTPVAGSQVSDIVASARPVAARRLAFLESEALFAMASGGYRLPEPLRERILQIYQKMPGKALPKGVAAADLEAIMDVSLRRMGLPYALHVRQADGALLVQGVMDVKDAAGYLREQLEMVRSPAYGALMQSSGIVVGPPQTREYKSLSVERLGMSFDEKRMLEGLRSELPQGAPDADAAMLRERLQPMRAVMGLLTFVELAVKGDSLAFGMGDERMVEQALDMVDAPARESGVAGRIQAKLCPAAAPCVLGRLSLEGIAQCMLEIMGGRDAGLPAATAAAGDGLIFAEWIENGRARSSVLLPTSEVLALKKALGSMTPQRGVRPNQP